MTYSKREFAKDLKAQLDLGYEPKRVGSWAHEIYLQHCGKIDNDLEEIIIDLFVLEEGPEFEFPESKLMELIKSLELDSSIKNTQEKDAQEKQKYLETSDSSIEGHATELDKEWLFCPDCLDAWESNSRDAMVICPKCNHAFHNPRYNPKDLS